MNVDALKMLLEELRSGDVGVDDALARLRALPFESIECATVDHHRAVRCGFPEVIFCQGKTAGQVVEIARRLAEGGNMVLGTRGNIEQLEQVGQIFPKAEINFLARSFLINFKSEILNQPSRIGNRVAVVSAGTADGAVAEEAVFTLRAMEVPVLRIADAGVAGLHRLLPHVADLQKCCAAVVIAGMEGALPSVVGGLVACPVYAVPTSVGYGTSFGGLTALLAMLNSCAANVSVVNIDNGFGAAISASLVWRQAGSAAK